jgi:hypothetical protein
MDTIPEAVDQAFRELSGWLDAQGVGAAGPPSMRFLVIGMAAELKIELAVPVDGPVAAGSGPVSCPSAGMRCSGTPAATTA